MQGQGEICSHFRGQMLRFDKCLSEDTSSRNLRVLLLVGRRACSRSFGETANRSLEPCRVNKPQPWVMVSFLSRFLPGSSLTRSGKPASPGG